jgi:hypothetical protein
LAKETSKFIKIPFEDEKNKIRRFFDYALISAFFIFLITITSFKIFGDDDVFWHLATGRYIVEKGVIPSQEIFGYVTGGIKWIPFEWGWEVLTFLLFQSGGYFALSVIRTFIIVMTFLLFFIYLKKRGISTAFVVTVLTVVALTILPRFSIRPQIIYYFFLAALLIMLLYLKSQNNKYKNSIYFLIPVMTLIWANMHMGVLLGMALFFVFILSEIIDYFYKKDSLSKITQRKELKYLIYSFFISSLFLLINPFFLDTYLYTYEYMKLDMLHSINEWKSPFDSSIPGSYNNKIFMVFVFSGLTIIYYSVKQKDFFPAFCYIGITFYSIQSVRYIAEFFIIILVFWVLSFDFILRKLSKKFLIDFISKNIIYKISVIIILIFLIVNAFNNKLYKDYFGNIFRETGIGVNERFFPVRMFNFIRGENIDKIGEKPFNNLKIGGYFIWEFPESKNFIDSRDLSDSIYALYKNIDLKQTGFEKKIEMIGIDYVIYCVPYLTINATEIERNIISYLSRNNEKWKLIFWDDKSFLFVKNVPKFKDIIDRYEFKYLSPYNFIFNRSSLSEGYRNYRETVNKETKRKISEDPTGIFINDIAKFLKSLN